MPLVDSTYGRSDLANATVPSVFPVNLAELPPVQLPAVPPVIDGVPEMVSMVAVPPVASTMTPAPSSTVEIGMPFR